MSCLIHSPWLVALGLGAVLAVGCNKPVEPAAEQSPTAQTPEAPPPAPAVEAATPPRLDPSSIPTEQDFEEQVNQSITSKNLEAELDRLEKELAD